MSEYTDTIINEKAVRCYRITHEIWGKERECILTYSHALYTGQIKELNRDIASVIRSLKELNEQLGNPKSRMKKSKEVIQAKIKKILSKKYMGDIFETQVKEQESGSSIRVEYSINDTNQEMIAYKYFGKKLLISDRKDLSTFDILRTYREQDCIEKIFRATKDNDHCAIRPQFHYTDQKIRVHIFCSLLGLALTTILHKEVSKRGFESSKFHLLDVLSSIRRCWIKDQNNNKVTNVLEAMDNTQTTLWNIIQTL